MKKRIEKKHFLQYGNTRINLITFRYSLENVKQKITSGYSRIGRGEIYIHLQGNSTIYIGDHILNVKPGDVIVYNKREVHFSTHQIGAPYERFVIFFTAEHFRFVEQMPEKLLNFFYDRADYDHNLIRLTESQRKKLVDLCFEITRYKASDEFDDQLHLFTSFFKILQIINNGYANPAEEVNLLKTPIIIKEMVAYINEHYADPISLDEIAKQIHISKSHASSYFKKHLGISPYEYLLNVRLEHAKRLLSVGVSLSEVYSNVGFNDYSYFIQFFKKCVGVTPYRYQKEHTGTIDSM